MHSTNDAHKEKIITGLIPVIALAIAAGLVLLCAATLVAEAASQPKYQDEAEYNAWNKWDRDTEVYVPFVNSDPARGWQTTAIVQNTEPNTATVVLRYYDTAGVETEVVNDELPPWGSRAYPTTDVFSGSLRVTATQRVVVVANDAPLDPGWTGDSLMSYRGASAGNSGREIHLLPIYRAYEGWNSSFAVQNIENTTAPISMTVYNLSGTVVFSQTDALPPYTTHLYDAASLPGQEDGSVNRVRIESVNRIVGVTKNANNQTGEAVAHNNRRLEPVGTRAMPMQIYLPLVVKHSLSTLVVYNLTENTSDVTATLYDVGGTAVSSSTLSLAPYATRFISLDSNAWSPLVPDGFEGSALIEFTEPVGILVNTSWSPAPDTFTGYSGFWFDVSDAFYVPFVRNTADGSTTRISVQNASWGELDADVTVTYYDEMGNLAGTKSALVKDNATHVFEQASSDLPVPFRGSALVTATTSIAVVGFVSHRPGTEAIISPESGGELVYTETQGLTTTVLVPPDLLSETTTFVFALRVEPPQPISPSLGFAGRAFLLEAYQAGKLVPGLVFAEPLTVTIHYSPTDVVGLDPNSLALLTWRGSGWKDAACRPIALHPDEGWLAVPICHLSEFVLVGEREHQIYLPLILRE